MLQNTRFKITWEERKGLLKNPDSGINFEFRTIFGAIAYLREIEHATFWGALKELIKAFFDRRYIIKYEYAVMYYWNGSVRLLAVAFN